MNRANAWWGEMSGLDIHYHLGEGHPPWGDACPISTSLSPVDRYAFEPMHAARPLLLNFAPLDCLDIAPWSDRIEYVNAKYTGAWELPVIGKVDAPAAVLVRPDGHVAWIGDGLDVELGDALTFWFGAPVASACRTGQVKGA